jgi:hypothetical protein
LGLGSLGIFLLVAMAAVMVFLGDLYPGFNPDGPGMSASDRNAAASGRVQEIVQGQILPLLALSVLLIGYGFYEAHVEQKRRQNFYGAKA